LKQLLSEIFVINRNFPISRGFSADIPKSGGRLSSVCHRTDSTFKINKSRYTPLEGETRELWQKLCEQAATEQDPERLLQLSLEINRLLTQKESRIQSKKSGPNAA
jgi:hypothetical protein